MTRSRLLGGSAAFLFAGLGPRILLAPDGGAGAGGDAGAAAGAAGGTGGTPDAAGAAGGAAAAAGQAGGGDSGGAAAYRPDGLPDHMAGATDKETIDKLFTANKGFRDSQAKFEPAPADAAGYAIDWDDKVKPFMADIGDDKFFAGIKEDLLAAGMGNKQASTFLNRAFGRMLDMDLVEKQVDVEAEKLKLTPADARGLPPAERDAAIVRRVANNTAFVESFVGRGFDAEAAKAINAELAAFPELNQFVEFLRHGQNVNPAPGGNAPSGVTQADLEKRMADPRQRFGTPQYDAEFARETDRLFRQLHGG
jgi:hypothetical protein